MKTKKSLEVPEVTVVLTGKQAPTEDIVVEYAEMENDPAQAPTKDIVVERAKMDQADEEEPTSVKEEPEIRRPRLQDHLPGLGPPAPVRWGGKTRELHDGGGLCSPGRWIPQKTDYLQKGLAHSRWEGPLSSFYEVSWEMWKNWS